jgi:glycosyltransferase involved in cell wall biosynthesis
VKKKIVILTSFFCGWNGGVDLICYFLKAINFNSKKYSIYIFIPKKNFLSNLKRYLFPLFQFFIFLKNRKIKTIYEWKYKKGSDSVEKYILENLNNKNINIKYVDFINEKKLIKKIDPDIIFPVLNSDYDKTKAIGYIFDFQHEYFKKNFSKKIISQRRSEINNLSKLDLFFVNSKNTKNDLVKFHKNFRNKTVKVIPFTPNIQKKFLFQNLDYKKYYKSNTKYFIICNQFWKHKNHYLALKVFEEYIKKNGKYNLILTGDLNYVKDLDYIKIIKSYLSCAVFQNRVFYTGNIKKEFQIELLKNSEALIQPSLFEGGPGAGSINEAISLDLPIIASNIKINKEIIYKKIYYFDSDKELLKKLFFFEKIKKNKLNKKKQLKLINRCIKNCSDFFVKSFDEL